MQLFNLMQTVYSKMGWTSKNPSLPVMFVSGSEDPCRKMTILLRRQLPILNVAVILTLTTKLYQDMRHEVFNEKEKELVYEDILKFLEIKAGIEVEDGTL